MSQKRFKKRRRKILLLFSISVLLLSALVFIFYSGIRHDDYISPLPGKEIVSSLEYRRSNDKKHELESLLYAKSIDFSYVSASDSSYIVNLPGDSKAIISTKKSLSDQVSSLQSILSRLTMEGKAFIKLDLRFNKPVIEVE